MSIARTSNRETREITLYHHKVYSSHTMLTMVKDVHLFCPVRVEGTCLRPRSINLLHLILTMVTYTLVVMIVHGCKVTLNFRIHLLSITIHPFLPRSTFYVMSDPATYHHNLIILFSAQLYLCGIINETPENNISRN